MFFFNSINEIPEDIYLDNILNQVADEDDDLEDPLFDTDIDEEDINYDIE